MTDTSHPLIEEFLAACHQAAAQGLMRCSSGNMSCRLDETQMLATASRTWMADITADQVSVCGIADAEPLSGPKPTVEIAFHAQILRHRPDVNVVMHFQTPHATAVACRDDEIDFFVIPEIPFYIGPITRVPYLPPGSSELADAVANAMQHHDLAIMNNHGLVTVAADYAHAIQNAVFFELACEIIAHAGENVRSLPMAEIQALLDLRKSSAKNV